MRSIVIFLSLISTFLVGCGVNRQANQLKALEDCKYEIVSADSLFLAGTDISKLVNSKDREIDLTKMPALAFAYLRKSIPLEGRINLRIENPSNDLASINKFQYIVLVKGIELANGFVDQKVSIEPGSSTIVPVNVKANIYSFLSDSKTMENILDFVNGDPGKGQEKKGLVTLKIKPTISVGNSLINYPGFITVEKEISSKILF